MKIAVLLTCFNRVQTTLRCLESLYGQEFPVDVGLDVYLVDDGSPDHTGAIVAKKYPSIRVIHHAGGLYWSKGMRLAWDIAAEGDNYDFYLWLNDDVQLQSDALSVILHDYDAVGEKGCFVGAFAADNTFVDICYGATDENGSRVIPSGSPARARGLICGNLVLIPRFVYEKVGPIYDGYLHAYGDCDYGLLLKENRIPVYCPSKISGVCPRQPERYHHLKGLSLKKRICLLWNPKGYSLHDAFIYRYRHWGIIRAMVSCAHIIYIVFKGER